VISACHGGYFCTKITNDTGMENIAKRSEDCYIKTWEKATFTPCKKASMGSHEYLTDFYFQSGHLQEGWDAIPTSLLLQQLSL